MKKNIIDLTITNKCNNEVVDIDCYSFKLVPGNKQNEKINDINNKISTHE
jgi:hypothetical protein